MLQLVARRFNIFGLHVHVGVESPERCIYIMNRMLYYLPHLLALSANSPFWESMDTGLRSYRTKIFESLPVGGMPFYFKDWDDYTALVNNYISTDTIETIRELWWDIRPHPDFGTIETRICDMPPTVADCMAIAALIQAMVKKFDDDYSAAVPFKRPHPSVVRENKWRACRWGLDGEFLTKDGASTIGVKEAVGTILDSLEDVAKGLGSEAELAGIRRILKEGTGASRQMRVYEETGEFKEVARDLSDTLYREVGAPVKV
jgi:carboxylate-amine ligase